jgi:hypothetical protein
MVNLSKDKSVALSLKKETFQKHLPHAGIEYLDGYHASMVIQPGEVNRLLMDFIFTN